MFFLCNGHPGLFIHVPKTGGVAIKRAIRRYGKGAGNLSFVHSTVQQAAVHNPKRFKESYKFACVRNPWNYVVSYFLFISRQGTVPQEYRHATFAEWFLDPNPIKNELQHMFSEPDLPLVWRPQFDFITDEAGNVAVDRICTYENLHEDVTEVFNHFGVNDIELSKENVAPSYDYRSYHTDETIERVRNIFSREVAEFDYQF